MRETTAVPDSGYTANEIIERHRKLCALGLATPLPLYVDADINDLADDSSSLSNIVFSEPNSGSKFRTALDDSSEEYPFKLDLDSVSDNQGISRHDNIREDDSSLSDARSDADSSGVVSGEQGPSIDLGSFYRIENRYDRTLKHFVMYAPTANSPKFVLHNLDILMQGIRGTIVVEMLQFGGTAPTVFKEDRSDSTDAQLECEWLLDSAVPDMHLSFWNKGNLHLRQVQFFFSATRSTKAMYSLRIIITTSAGQQHVTETPRFTLKSFKRKG